MKHNKIKTKTIAYCLILIVLLLVVCICICFIIKDIYQYQIGKALYDQIATDYFIDNDNDIEEKNDDDRDIVDKTGDIDNIIVPPQINQIGLLAENSDYVGWLRIDGCSINLPIVKGESDEEYLHKGFNKEYIYQGTLFVESMNSSDFSDPNTIIYGHNMKNGSMFGNLKKFLDADFANSNNHVWVYTKDNNYRYTIYSIAIVRVDSEAYTLFAGFGENYAIYVQNRLADSNINMNVSPDSEVRTLTLSTCYGRGKDGNRLIIQAYRDGVYPSDGCTILEAENNELLQREKENR